MAIVLLAGCSGCLQDWTGWDDVPTAMVTPVAAPEQLDAWTFQVSQDVATWNTALERVGCPQAFSVGVGGHEVRLVALSDWRWGTSSGIAKYDWIEVRSKVVEYPRVGAVLLHEFGHALGLSHASLEWGPSLMTAQVASDAWLAERDVEAAACEMGCGPCDPSADPYDLR